MGEHEFAEESAQARDALNRLFTVEQMGAFGDKVVVHCRYVVKIEGRQIGTCHGRVSADYLCRT